MKRHLFCIVNPTACHGRAGKTWPELQRALRQAGLAWTVEFTRGPGHATELARSALNRGFMEIVCVGGDGTINEVINGFFENDTPVNPDARLGIVPRGTGSDLARTLRLPSRPSQAAMVIGRARTVAVDVGRLRCLSRDGRPCCRYFLNIADLGYGGALVDRVNGFTKVLGSFLSYFVGLLYTLTFYRNQTIHYRIDDGREEQGVFSSIVAANGQYFGGGMWVAPEARMEDGMLDFVLIGDVTKLEVLQNLPRIYRGTLAEHPKVVYRRGKKLEAWADGEVLLEADGELPGKLPVTIELLPRAVMVYA